MLPHSIYRQIIPDMVQAVRGSVIGQARCMPLIQLTRLRLIVSRMLQPSVLLQAIAAANITRTVL